MSNKKKSKPAPVRLKQTLKPWPMLLIAGGIALIGIVVYAAWQAATGGSLPKVPVEVNGAPSIKVDKENVDLGNVKLGQTVEVVFQVANVGDQQLRLTEAPYIEVVEGC